MIPNILNRLSTAISGSKRKTRIPGTERILYLLKKILDLA